jgi:dolichol-phosphate mannosyltransferase
MYLSIVLPTYNEAGNIEKLISLICAGLQNLEYEIIVVDDNSPDKTGEISEKLSQKFPVKVLHRKSKLGLSSAVLDGFKIAKGNLLCVMDSDFSHPPEKIIELVNFLEKENADIVVASRLVKGSKVENWPVQRKIMSFCARLLAKPLTSVKDPMSGFFIVKKNVIKSKKLNPLGYKILLEILAKGNYKKVAEYPFTFKDRVYGETKMDKKVIFEYLVQAVSLYGYKIAKHEIFSEK